MGCSKKYEVKRGQDLLPLSFSFSLCKLMALKTKSVRQQKFLKTRIGLESHKNNKNSQQL